MDRFSFSVNENKEYLIGYAVAQKSECEVFNFVSNSFRILHFLDGSAEWRVGDDLQVFSAGDVVIFNNLHKRNIHQVLTGVVTYEFFDFLPSCLPNETLRNFFYTQIHRVVTKKDDIADRIYLLLASLKDEIERPEDEFQIISIKQHLGLITLAFYRNMEAQNPRVNPALAKITNSIQYIQMHLGEDIKVTQLAKACGYSAEYFSRVFKKYMGVSPISYIINLRLETVTHLVATTDMTVLNAAYQSGFQSSSAFYKAFKAYRSGSPTQLAHKEIQ